MNMKFIDDAKFEPGSMYVKEVDRRYTFEGVLDKSKTYGYGRYIYITGN